MTRLALALVAAAGVVSFAAAEAMRRASHVLGFTDAPNERSSHAAPTPRAGGIGFAFGVPILAAAGMHAIAGSIGGADRAVLLAAPALAIVGLADDRWGLPPAVRMLAQLIAAGAVVAAGGVLHAVGIPGVFAVALGPLAVPLTIAWIVSVTNIYNFMDGIDGLAGVQAIVAALALASITARLGHADLTIALLTLCGGVLGFLILNRPPARVFMGDVGSTFLGFLLAAWAVTGSTREPPVPFVAWVWALSVFLFDGLLTIARRLLRGERIYEAHRTHVYQRLVAAGWSHGRTTALYGGLAAIVAGGIAAQAWLSLPAAGIYPMLALLLGLIPFIERRSVPR